MRLRLKLPSPESVATWANIAGGLGTAAAAGLAFWAYFFTDIAAELTKQYNAQVAELNEQLIDLRQERRAVQDQATQALAEKQAAETQIKQLQATYDALSNDAQAKLSALSGQAAKLTEELESLQLEKSQALADLGNTRAQLSKSAKDKEGLLVELVRRQVDLAAGNSIIYLTFDYEDDAQTAADLKTYIEARDALAAFPRQSTFSSQEEVDAYSKKLFELIQRVPGSWRNWERPSNQTKPPAEFAELGTEDGVKAFRRHIAKSASASTAREYVEKTLLDANYYTAISASDMPRVKKALTAFVNNHAQELAGAIEVSLPETASTEQVVVAGQTAMANISKLRSIIMNAADEVAGLIKN
jgi:hypothetical protein